MIQLEHSHRGVQVPFTEGEANLREMAVRVIAAKEEERSRVAREIHDDLGQKIALLSLELGQLGQKLKASEPVRRQFQHLQHQIEAISTDVHRLVYKLHPAKLADIGLVPAIKGLCFDLNESGSMRIEFRHEGSFAKLSKEVSLCVFRTTQEALRNCVKHSGADFVRVLLVNTGTDIKMLIADEGQGFVMNRKNLKRGLGFTSMRERLRIVGGTVSVNSRPSHGTKLEISIPLGIDN
jgi:signal transduction histidine kinase